MNDNQVSVIGGWAIASDGVQWILQRLRLDGRPPGGVSYVRTSKTKLRQCCEEKGVPLHHIEPLLEPLPDYFPGWDARCEAFADRYSWFIAGKGPRPVWIKDASTNA